jgi:hypothetical protein
VAGAELSKGVLKSSGFERPMGQLIRLKRGKMTVYVESTDVETRGLVEAGDLGGREKSIDKLLGVIEPVSESILNAVHGLGERTPDSVSAEFGLSFTAGGNICFVKASGEASLKVTLTWRKA